MQNTNGAPSLTDGHRDKSNTLVRQELQLHKLSTCAGHLIADRWNANASDQVRVERSGHVNFPDRSPLTD